MCLKNSEREISISKNSVRGIIFPRTDNIQSETRKNAVRGSPFPNHFIWHMQWDNVHIQHWGLYPGPEGLSLSALAIELWIRPNYAIEYDVH